MRLHQAGRRSGAQHAYALRLPSLAGTLEVEGIPFVPAVGGMFVWVDLR